MNSILIAALDLLNDCVNLSTGLTHLSDRHRASEMFVRLRDAGVVLPFREIESWAVENGWQPADAQELALRAVRIAEGLKPRITGGPWWRDDLFEQLQKMAAEAS